MSDHNGVDIRIKKVSVLQGRARAEAEKLKLQPDNLVLVKTEIRKGSLPQYHVEKIVGDPVSFLLKKVKSQSSRKIVATQAWEKLPILRIEWKDAKSCTHLDFSELPDALKLAPYFAVGFKIAESKEALVLCEGFLPPLDKYEELTYRAVLSIPKALIVKVEELQVKSAKT